MSIERLTTVLQHSRATGSAKVVLLGIANHDGDGGAWPKVLTLGRYARLRRRGLQKCLQQLVQLGELEISVQGGGTRDTPDHKRPNRYTVLVDCPEGCRRDTNHTPAPGWVRVEHGDYRHATPAELNMSDAQLADLGLTLGREPVDNKGRPPGHPTQTGASARTPLGASPRTPEPSLEPVANPVPTTSRGPREAVDASSTDTTPPCQTCSAPNLSTCAARQAKLAPDARHRYTAARRRA